MHQEIIILCQGCLINRARLVHIEKLESCPVGWTLHIKGLDILSLLDLSPFKNSPLHPRQKGARGDGVKMRNIVKVSKMCLLFDLRFVSPAFVEDTTKLPQAFLGLAVGLT